MFTRSTFLALAASAAVLTGASAATPAAARAGRVSVSYADLNLASLAGRATLDRRIDNAARELCGDFSPNDLHMRSLARACRADLTGAAHLQVASLSARTHFASASSGASQAAF